jgi:hypothetical protein
MSELLGQANTSGAIGSGLLGRGDFPTAYPANDVEAATTQEARWSQERHDMIMGQHLNVLLQAQRLRADPALMAQLRVWVRDKKDELTTVLDDLG